MEETKFNLYKLCLCEKNIALPLLQHLFVTLWNKTFLNEKWEWKPECVRLFEEKMDEVSLPTGARRKRSYVRSHNWMSQEWDIGKLAFAVIDTGLFHLAPESVSCVARIRDWRNDLAHSSHTKYTPLEFTRKLQDLKIAVGGLSTEIDVCPFTSGLDDIETMEVPADPKEVRRLSEECVALQNELHTEMQDEIHFLRDVLRDSTQQEIMKRVSQLEESLTIAKEEIGLLKEKLEQSEKIQSDQKKEIERLNNDKDCESHCCAFPAFNAIINRLTGGNRHFRL